MKLIFSVEKKSEVEGIHISQHQKNKKPRHQSSYLQLMIGVSKDTSETA